MHLKKGKKRFFNVTGCVNRYFTTMSQQSFQRLLGLVVIASMALSACQTAEGSSLLRGRIESANPAVCNASINLDGDRVDRVIFDVGIFDRPSSYGLEGQVSPTGDSYNVRFPAYDKAKVGAIIAQGTNVERNCAAILAVTTYWDGVAKTYMCDIDRQRENKEIVCIYIKSKEER